MKSQWKRLVLAAIISSSVFAVTWFWYKSTEDKISMHGNEKPLAYVGKVFEDIQRRPASRLLWQSVFTGEPLFNGEAIRTSEKGEVRIQFAGTDKYLDLEPESLIVIKKSEGEIALDLMEGSLFVNAKNGAAGADATGGGPGLVLNSASGRVDLTGASASLSKNKGSQVDVQVLEGTASLQGKDGKMQDLTSGSGGALGANGMQFNRSSLQILSPTPQKPVYMDAEDIKPVTFRWKGFPSNSVVALYLGSTRKEMKEIATNKNGTESGAESHPDQLTAKVGLGKYYWKLVAKTPAGQELGESSVYRTEVLTRYAPTVVFPMSDAEVPTVGQTYDMTFKWEKGDETKQVSIEVWSDKDLKNKVASKSFADEDSFTVPALKDGTYFWRMSAFFADADKPVMGKIQKFKLAKSDQLVQKKKEERMVEVSWNLPEAQQKNQFYIDKPVLDLNWKANKTADIASWRVKMHEENEDPSTAKMIDVTDSKIKAPVVKPGRYIASIQALDKDGEILGNSPEKAILLAPLPLLKAPTFVPADGVLKAGNDGRSELRWEKLDGAKEYWLTILKDGKELKKSKYVSLSTQLKNLMPGEYSVKIQAVDEHGRMSEQGEMRKLVVPESSGLKAPSVKKIKVN